LDVGRFRERRRDYCYRFNAFWTIFFECLSLVFLFLLYRGWKRYGGMKNYRPPATGVAVNGQ
jgi:hypothetical protein